MKITIYTTSDCPYCKAEKEYLASQNISFEEKNVEKQREFLTEMLAASDNFAGVPFTLIVKDDGTQVGLKGFTKEEFDLALGLPTVVQSAPVTPTTSPAAPATPQVETSSPSVTPATATPAGQSLRLEASGWQPLGGATVVETPVVSPAIVEPTVGASITETATQPEMSTSAAAEPISPNNPVEMGQTQSPVTVGSDMANSASSMPEPTITETPAPLSPAETPTDSSVTQQPHSQSAATGEELKGVLNNLEALSTDAKPQEAPTPVETPVQTPTITSEVSLPPVPEVAPEQVTPTVSTEPQPQPEVQTAESVQTTPTSDAIPSVPTPPSTDTPSVPDFGKS